VADHTFTPPLWSGFTSPLTVFLVNGRYDVILHLTVKDVDHLRNVGLDRITSQPVVVNIETSIVYDSRSRRELPILLEGRQLKDTALHRDSARSKGIRRP
jgi:hypothetical protein